MNLHDAMNDACRQVGIKPPRSLRYGQWNRTDTLTKNGKQDASVLIFDDGVAGIAKNWQTMQELYFSVKGAGEYVPPPPRQRDYAAERRAAERQREVEAICLKVVRACEAETHPYLERKGFPNELGLVLHDVAGVIPDTDVGRAMLKYLPKSDAPLLIVPGRVGKTVTTFQAITIDGDKKNALHGKMDGACHSIATGRETWVCEGIATALAVKAALGLLGRSATVLSAFSASNAAKVARSIRGAIIATDNDKPVDAFGGLGTGEHWSRKSGCRWVMPPERGDFDDMYLADGLRAVALKLREVPA